MMNKMVPLVVSVPAMKRSSNTTKSCSSTRIINNYMITAQAGLYSKRREENQTSPVNVFPSLLQFSRICFKNTLMKFFSPFSTLLFTMSYVGTKENSKKP